MAQDRTTTLQIHLTAEERHTLLRWQRSTTIAAGRARRGRMLLLRADGVSVTVIARTIGSSRRFVYKWVDRFLQEGIEGLIDAPRCSTGAPSVDMRETPANRVQPYPRVALARTFSCDTGAIM
jgi:hypothetical protein